MVLLAYRRGDGSTEVENAAWLLIEIGSEGSHSLPLSALSGLMSVSMSVFAKMTNPKKKALKNQGFARIWWGGAYRISDISN